LLLAYQGFERGESLLSTIYRAFPAMNLRNVLQNEEEAGASMVEYALIAALIAVVCIAAVTFLGQQASQSFSSIASSINTTN